jgi:hypothetical protein
MNAQLVKRCSPNTHPVGPNKINRSVTLTFEAEQFLCRLASEVGESVNEFCRRALAMRAEALRTQTALAFKAALNSQKTARFAMFFFAVAIPALSFAEGDEFEARRPRRSGMCARTCAHPIRKPQVAA